MGNHTCGQERHRKFTEGLVDCGLILEELGVAPGQTVVDAGCGTGYMARLFADCVGSADKVYALDINDHYLKVLDEELVAEGVSNVFPLLADLAGLTPVPDHAADVVYISTVLHAQHRDKLPDVVAELSRMLRPGGLLGVVEMEKCETPFGPPLSQRFSPRELQDVLPFTPLKTVSVARYFYLQIFRVPE